MRVASNSGYALIAFALLLAWHDKAVAQQTYFVSPTGSDTNAGTSSGQAWRTLQHAANQVGAGDTVQVLAGNYTGFDLRTSGSAGNPISFLAQSGVTINQVNSVTGRDGINIENASHIVIDGFNLQSPNSSSRAGIRVVGDGFSTGQFAQNITLSNNTATNWGDWGIFTGFADDMVITGNSTSGSVREHGIYVSNSGDRPVITNNLIFDNNANGIHLNGDINTGDTGFANVDGIISNATVQGNIIFGNGNGGGSGINGDGAVDAVIQNNLLYDNHASGISLFRIDGGAASTGGQILNNTIINADDARWVINLRNGATDATVFNNILFNLNDSSFRGSLTALEGSEVGLLSDFNLLDPRFSLDDNNPAIDLLSWQSATGNDLNSLAIDEATMQSLFFDYSSDDFELALNSLAIDFGVSGLNNNGSLVSAPLFDLLNRSRPEGLGFDAGAYEISSVPEPGCFGGAAVAILSMAYRRRRRITKAT